MADDLTVATPSNAWTRAERVRSVHRWLLQVSAELRVAEERFLPRQPGERAAPIMSDRPQIDPWAYRAARSLLWPYFPMGLWGFVGRVVGDKFKADIPENLKATYTDIDKQGRDYKVFSQQLCFDMWNQGEPFVLVDSAVRGSVEPKWIFFASHQVIRNNKGYDKAGVRVSKRVHIKDTVTSGRWGSEKIGRVRVLLGDGEPSQLPDGKQGPGAGLGERGARFEFYREDPKDKTKWLHSEEPNEQPGRFANEPTEIPGYSFDFGRRDEEEGDAVIPASEWLGELCRHFYREASDHGSMIAMLRAVLLYWSKMTPKEFKENYGEMVVGPYTLFFGPEGSDLKTVETTGSAAELSFRDLERYLVAIRLAQLAPVNPEKVQTLGETLINVHLTEATLRASAIRLRDGLEQLMRITAAQMGLSDPGTLEVPTDFSLTEGEEKEVALLTKLHEGFGSGPLLSWQTTMERLQTKSAALEDIDLEEEAERLRQEAQERDEAAARRIKNFAPIGE